MVKSEQGVFTTLDLYLASYLLFHGITPQFDVKDRRVIFVFPVSEKLYNLTMSFNSNVNVPVADYVVALKTLRGQMLTMRG